MHDDKDSARMTEEPAGMWSIDAEATLQAVYDDPGCPPLLRQTLTGTLVWQDRLRRNVRRAVLSSGVAPLWSGALLVLRATATIEGDDGPTQVPVETLLAQKRAVNVTALHVRTKGLRWGEARVGRAPADDPIVAAVAAVEMDGDTVRQARVAITGAGPLHLAEAPGQLVGGFLDEERIRAVAKKIEAEVTPEGDFRGSAEYRRAMAGVLARRALMQCLRGEDTNG